MTKKLKITRADLHNLGSLITYKNGDGRECCIGYLIDFKGHGVHDANFGQMDITPEEAEAHNTALDTAMLEGLDKNCEIGMGGTFYYTDKKVKTFIGTTVSTNVKLNGKNIVFQRNGMKFQGILKKDADCFNFKRIA